jgi:cyanate permease
MDNSSEVKVYGYRWVMLAAFMFINITIQILWICYAPVTHEAMEFYGASELSIGLLAMLFMFIYIPLAIPAAWAIDTYGLRRGVGLGAILLGVFGLLRGLSTTSFTLTVVFTIGLAIAQPLLLNAFAKLAAVWFPFKQRATIIGLMFLATFLGIAIGEALTPALVIQFGFATTQLIYGVTAAISAAIFLIIAREKPPTPASPPGFEARALVLDGLKQILHQRDFYYLAFALFVGNGIFNGLSTWVESIVRPKGLSATEAGDLGALMLVGGIVGAVVMPALSDRLRKRKPFLVFGFMLAIPGLVGIVFGASYGLLLGAFFTLGLFTTGIAPVAYQYGVEITYPAPEGTSNGLFALVGQIAVVFIFGMGWSNDALGSFEPSLLVLVGLMILTCVLLALLRESPMITGPGRKPIEPVARPIVDSEQSIV